MHVFDSHSAFSSPHSVDPTRPYSSLSHDAINLNILLVYRKCKGNVWSHIDLFGLHPIAVNLPSPLATSFIAVLPLIGSIAPQHQESWWFPRMIVSSLTPSTIPITL